MRQFIKTCDLRNIVDDIACDEISKKRRTKTPINAIYL